jgi:ABC-2 type transport system ATP-binding protein
MINMAPGNAVQIAGLRVVRGGRPVLDGLDLGVARGSVTGLLGPSGCGKSSLLRAIVGVQKVAAGTVTVLGEPAGSPTLRDQIGYVTQSPSVYLDLTVRQNLEYFAAIYGVGEGETSRAMREVGLTVQADVRSDQLSGGQLNRVSLAVAMLTRPRLLVLDEPTVGLDPVLRRELWSLFAELADSGTTILVSSHVMDEAERCHHLILMRDGVILAVEPPQRLKERLSVDDVETAFLRLVQGTGVSA